MQTDLTSRLELPPEEMRQLGYAMVDLLVGHTRTLRDQPVCTPPVTRGPLQARLGGVLPIQGRSPLEVLKEVGREVFTAQARTDHPRFFAMVPGPSNFVSVMADALAAGFNVHAATWKMAPAATQVELTTIAWLTELCGLPEQFGGLFINGASSANLMGLLLARETCASDCAGTAVAYCSDQTHPTVDRAMRVLGFAPHQLRRVRCDADLRIDLGALRAAMAADRERGLQPFCIIANAGTTDTGAIDPLPELAALARAEELWFHVDGAYGAAAALTPRGRKLLQGLGDADSIALDPHKWLFQPYETGCILVREPARLQQCFRLTSHYLAAIESQDGGPDLKDRGLQLTRSFRALKLYMSLKTFGAQAFREAVERGFALAELAEAEWSLRPGWRVVTRAQLGVVTFRFQPEGMSDHDADVLNRRLADELQTEGFAAVNSTRLGGRSVLRMCTINPRTTEEDISETVAHLCRLAERAFGAVTPHTARRRAGGIAITAGDP